MFVGMAACTSEIDAVCVLVLSVAELREWRLGLAASVCVCVTCGRLCWCLCPAGAADAGSD